MNTNSRILLRSTCYAIAAYFIAVLVETFIVATIAVVLGFNITIVCDEVVVKAVPNQWNQENVLLIYLFPFLLQCLILVMLHLAFQRLESRPRFRNIFILWLMFFLAYRLMGTLFFHMFFNTGIYHAARWLYLGSFIRLGLGVVGAGFFMLLGYKLLRDIYLLNGTFRSDFTDPHFSGLLRSAVIIPLIFLIIISFLFYLPGLPYDEIMGLVILAAVMIILYFRKRHEDPALYSFQLKVPDKARPYVMLSITLACVILLRVLLGLGVTLG